MNDIDNHGVSTPLHTGINGLQQGGPGLSSGTNSVRGLQGAAAQFGSGLGDRGDVPNIIIFITDGDDTAGNSNTTIARVSRDTGAEVFAVGVGNEIRTSTLNAIATDDAPGSPGYNASDVNAGHRFYATEFTGLIDIIDDLTEAVIVAAQYRLFLVTSQVDGQGVTALAAVGADGSYTLVSWTVQ